MRKELPVRPSIEHLKSQAKDLLDAYRRKDREALERFRDGLPRASGASHDQVAAMGLALHDAQSVIAREYGFASWADLRARVDEARPSAETLRALIAPHLGTPLPSEVEATLLAAMREEEPHHVPLGSPLPMLPLRNAVLAVGAVAPLHVGRRTSIAAIEAARNGAKALAVFAQKEESDEAPTEASLHPVGCAVQLLSVVPSSETTVWIVVRATQWVRLQTIEQRQPYLLAQVAPFRVEEEVTSEVTRLEQTLRERVRALAATLPHAEPILHMTERMTPLQLADLTIANLPCSVEDKARYASFPSLLERLAYVLSLFDRAA